MIRLQKRISPISLRARLALTLMVGSFIFGGCTLFLSQAELEKRYGANPPVIKAFYAPKSFGAGGILKVYINVHDPDGDLKDLDYTMQPYGPYPTSYGAVFVRQEDAKDLSGYIYWNAADTAFLSPQMTGIDLNFLIYAEDRAGHASEPIKFTMELAFRHEEQKVPEAFDGLFKEKPIGPMFIRLYDPGEDGQSSRDDD